MPVINKLTRRGVTKHAGARILLFLTLGFSIVPISIVSWSVIEVQENFEHYTVRYVLHLPSSFFTVYVTNDAKPAFTFRRNDVYAVAETNGGRCLTTFWIELNFI